MNNLSNTKLFVLSVLTIFATVLNFFIVISELPPAAIAYFFGALSGANWVILLVLFLRRFNID